MSTSWSINHNGMSKKTSTHTSARDVFSYLLLVSMFVVSMVNILAILFQIINLKFPEGYDFWTMDGVLEGLRGHISSIVIAWPVTVGMYVVVGKDLRANTEKRNTWIRKWLLHLLLFVSAVTVIISLITLINIFLNGELTIRFALKILSVLMVSVGVFAYQRWDLLRDPKAETRIPTYAAIIGSLLMILLVVTGLSELGSPKHNRFTRLDEERIMDLQQIQSYVVDYWRQKEELPTSLEDVEDEVLNIQLPVDPKTNVEYRYKKVDDLSFELCGTFDTSVEKEQSQPSRYPAAMYAGGTWEHGTGFECFERTIDPERVNPDKESYIY